MSEQEKIPIRQLNMDKKMAGISKWKIDAKDKKEVKDGWIKALRLGELTGKVVKDGGLSVYLSDIKIALEFFKKPTAKLTLDDIKRLHEAMIKDELTHPLKKRVDKEINGKIETSTITIKKPYSRYKKISIRNSLILYLKWKFDDGAYKFIKILKIKMGGKVKEVDAPPEEEVEKLIDACTENYERFFVCALFDTGCRAEEFHNIRMEDVLFPKTGENFIKIRVREAYSKTKGRVISCYWKHSTKIITDYYNERLKEGAKPTDPVFPKTYPMMRKFLHRLGLRALGKSIHYHALRHASATHYIYIIKNDHQMNYRYGWNFGSPMIQRYSRRRDLSEELDKEVEQTEMSTLKSEIEKLKLSGDMKDKEFEKMKSEFAKAMQKNAAEMERIQLIVKDIKST
ncbi:MAG TPA: site-specific integrase [Candidatus Paceibacterota bacterium]|nr:site-specific integrase [Candidatus Paceibacterota bacterium]